MALARMQQSIKHKSLMKKIFPLLLLAASVSLPLHAQDDDVYFVPSKSKKEVRTDYRPAVRQSEVDMLETSAGTSATSRSTISEDDVDAYNRRYRPADTLSSAAVEDVDDAANYSSSESYTIRLVRFHSPSVGVWVSSPYYAVVTDDLYADIWLDPWDLYYSPWYSPYYRPYWGWGWSSCSSFWWSYGWGWDPYWHHHHYPIWHYPHHPIYPGGHPGYAWRPSGRPSSRPIGDGRLSYRPSREYGQSSGRLVSGRPSRSYSTTPSSGRGVSTTRPSRQIGTSTRTTTPSNQRDYSSPSRSLGSSERPSRSYSSPSRSMGGSFGGGSVSSGRSMGGGRSVGGRGR